MARLLHIYRRYWPDEGGIEWTMRTFCEEAVRQGHEVSALVSAPTPRTVTTAHNGVQIIRSACLGTVANTPFCPRMPATIRRLQPDLVELHHAYPYGLWALLHSGFDGPFVLHYHFDISRFGPLQAVIAPLMQRGLQRADCIFVNSQGYAETSPVVGPWLEKCEFIPPGVDPRKLDLTPEMQARVAELQRGDRLQVLFVGRLSHYKGLPELVTAMQWVEGELTLVGRGQLAGELAALAERLGIADRVHFTGRVDDRELVCRYHASEVVVLPSVSRGESFGLTQVEAMLAGKPVVCSDLPGVCEVGVDGVTCCVVPRGEPRALAEALQRLGGDAELRRRLGEAGRQRALAEFDLQKVIARRLAVYDRLLGMTTEVG
jgi:rhamnosyl/mannosyltransferase